MRRVEGVYARELAAQLIRHGDRLCIGLGCCGPAHCSRAAFGLAATGSAERIKPCKFEPATACKFKTPALFETALFKTAPSLSSSHYHTALVWHIGTREARTGRCDLWLAVPLMLLLLLLVTRGN